MKLSQTVKKSQYKFISKKLSGLSEESEQVMDRLFSTEKGIIQDINSIFWPDYLFLLSLFRKIQSEKEEIKKPELNLFISDSSQFVSEIFEKMPKNVKKSELMSEKFLSEKKTGSLLITAETLITALISDSELINLPANLCFIQSLQSTETDWDREIWFIIHKLTASSQTIFLTAENVINKRVLSLFRRTIPLEINSIKNKNSIYYTFLYELEGSTVGFDKSEMLTKSEALGEAIDLVIKNIRENEDPVQMNMYRKLFRKHVPFMMRHYFAAWMMKEYLDKNGKKKKWGKTLFISVGKNRKVYPKDLISLFSTTGEVKKEEIGDIKIMDSYSFLNINPKSADKAIEKLDGTEYRGRKLTVNFARKNS